MKTPSPAAARPDSPAVRSARARKFWREWLKPVLVILLLSSALRSAFADWNDVPTGSMKPTILEGDRIWVNKLAYDLKAPFTTHHLAEWGGPQRGEIVVFFSPANGIRLVKRVVGLPGDIVAVEENRLLINGEPVAYEPLAPGIGDQITAAERSNHDFASERLGDHPHPLMFARRPGTPSAFGPVQVPPSHYFMLGDNRDNSFDSRYFGCVERQQIVGRATAVALSFDPARHYAPRWHRWFSALP